MLIEPTIKIARSNQFDSYIGNTIEGFKNTTMGWDDFKKGCQVYAYLPVILDEYDDLDIGRINEEDKGRWKMKGLTLGYSNIIALDVDNNTKDGSQVSIKNFKERFRFKYYLLTTKSHKQKKANGKDRYRVWIPVKNTIMYQRPEDYAKAIKHIGRAIGLTTDDDKLDCRPAVMESYQPKFERSPKDAYTYDSEYDTLLDFDKFQELYHWTTIDTATLEREGNKQEKSYSNNGEVREDYLLHTADGEEVMLNNITEDTTIYCPICESNPDEHKTPTATAYYKEESSNSFSCWKNKDHYGYTIYKNKITGGFIDETK